MATVKFSGELRDRIINNAKIKFQSAVNVAKESAPKDWGPRLYDIIFANDMSIINQVPDYWLKKESSIDIHCIGDLAVGLSFTLNPVRPYPINMPENKVKGMLARKRSHYSDDLILVDAPEFAEFKADVIRWRKQTEAAVQRQSEFANSVSKVINAYATLAPALKAWPPLWDLIPDDIKEKHKKIVERERNTPELDVDLDRMTALASFSKIGGQ